MIMPEAPLSRTSSVAMERSLNGPIDSSSLTMIDAPSALVKMPILLRDVTMIPARRGIDMVKAGACVTCRNGERLALNSGRAAAIDAQFRTADCRGMPVCIAGITDFISNLAALF